MQQADFCRSGACAESLETMSLATRMSQLVGMPIEKTMAALPDIGLILLPVLSKWL